MTEIEADVTRIDGVEVFDRRLFLRVATATSVPSDPPDQGDDDVKAAVEAALLNAPDYPDDIVDVRDVVPVISHNKLVKARLRDIPGIMPGTPSDPGQAPVINTAMGTRGTVYLPDEGAKEGDRDATRAAMASAINKVKDGGRLFVPFGRWPMHDVGLPAHKDFMIEGETELGAELVGTPEKDILFFDDPGAQRRLQNRQIFKNLRFFMPGNGNRGSFPRVTTLGFKGGAACIAWRMPATEGDRRKDSWGSSYLTLENVTAHGEKDALGACLLWSDRPLYGFRARNIMIGDHGSDVSGLHGGICIGKPPARLTEATSDEFRVETMVHWGGVCSIAAYNIANGAIIDHKAYTCEMALHLTGYDDKGPRKRCRQMRLSELYYDNDVRPLKPTSPPMIYVDSDMASLDTCHIKGAKHGGVSPQVVIKGRDFIGGQFDIMSSQQHSSPLFKVEGNGHEFRIRAAGVPDAHKREKLVNNGNGHAGVRVL